MCTLKTLDIAGQIAFLLSSELATMLSGRYVEVKMLPLTFAEYLDFRKAKWFPRESSQSDIVLFEDGSFATLASLLDYFNLKRGIVDEKIYTVPQTDTVVYAFEYYSTEDGVKASNVVIALDTDNGEYEFVFKKAEPKDWTSQGGAFAKSISLKK